MKVDTKTPITSMKDLNQAKESLRLEIAAQEVELLENPLLSIPMALFDGTSVKGSIHDSLESFSLGNYKNAVMSLLSTFLMANRKTRKIFIVFMLAKELVPFVVHKMNDVLKK
ncbi:MAG: hypothetical protein WBV45_13540 [Lutimonas sp.]